MKSLNRRSFLQTTSVAGLTALAYGLSRNRAVADPDPPQNSPAPAGATPEPQVYSFPFGGGEAFVILDGVVNMPSIQPAFAPEAKPAQIEEILKKNFLPNRLALCVNVLALKTASGVTLFDAGCGVALGPIGGRLMKGLARAGIAPGDVKTVYVTHAHLDHISGLLNGAGEPVFGSAKIVAAKNEMDFWSGTPDLSGMRTPEEDRNKMAAAVKKSIGQFKAQLDLKEPGKLTPEVEMIATPGHTPGHAAYQITLGEDKMVVLGDSVHLNALQFPHPEWTMAFDTDPALAIKSRTKLFHQLAADRTMAMGYHLPFPGIGHVRANGKGFEWVPMPWVS